MTVLYLNEAGEAKTSLILICKLKSKGDTVPKNKHGCKIFKQIKLQREKYGINKGATKIRNQIVSVQVSK